jgi:hypothetical protein
VLKKLLDKEYSFIYFFPKDPVSIKANLGHISYEKIGKNFDEYIEIDYEPIWVKNIKEKTNIEKENFEKRVKNCNDTTKVKVCTTTEIAEQYLILEGDEDIFNKIMRILKRLWRKSIRILKRLFTKSTHFFIKYPKSIYKILNVYNIYIKKVIETVKKVSPDIIITSSDMTLSYRIIKKYFPNIELVVLQPCFLDFREREVRKLNFSKKVANFILGGVLFPKQAYFGLEDTDNKLLLFEDKFTEFYKNKRTNTYRVYNPYFTELHQNISTIARKKNYLKNLNKNINIEKPIVIIFIMDYSLIHGKEIQKYTETTYKKVIDYFKDDFNFFIKDHPRYSATEFLEEVQSYERVFCLNDELTYDELLSIGDINISINSNASLESLITGMPTINFLPLDLHKNIHFQWLSYYCGTEAHGYEDLIAILNSFLLDKTPILEKVHEGQKKLVGTKEECKKVFMEVLGS